MLRVILLGVGLTLTQPVAPGVGATMVHDNRPAHTAAAVAKSPGMEENRHLSRVIALKYQ